MSKGKGITLIVSDQEESFSLNLGWHDLFSHSTEIITDKALGKAKERIPRARDPLVQFDTK